ncbi:hypothetical protein FRC16_000782 [Serendipita sp. 398]|nr:hypothetical protein FRC16_000782 [Serendipita sp. 398]
MIPDRQFSSRGSVEGVLLSSGEDWVNKSIRTECRWVDQCVVESRSGAEIVEEDVHALAVGTIIFNNDTAAPDNLARISVLVDLAQSSPSAELLRIADLFIINEILPTGFVDDWASL